MSHEITNIDKVVLRGEQAWHGLGHVINDNLSAVLAAEAAGLLWPVDQRPIFWQAADGSFQPVDSHVANIRTADCDGNGIANLLGIVGADYSVCQNRELAEFTDALAQTGSVTIETVGSIRGGKRVWFLARGESFNVGATDKIYPYVLVSNGHDGGQAIRVTPTTVRVVCSNTLHMVIPRAEGERPESAAFVIRHTGKIADKLEQAKAALAYYGNTLARNRELYEAMQAKAMDRTQGMQLFAGSYAAFWKAPTDEELTSRDFEVRRLARNARERMHKAAHAFMVRYEHEALKTGLRDSSWAYFNALTGFIQHDKTARGADDSARVERRIESNLFGLNAQRTHEVLAAALAS